MSSSNLNKLGSIKTYGLVAWIFAILLVVAYALIFAIYFVIGLIIAAVSGSAGVAAIVIIYGIVVIVLMIPSILVMRRSGRIYHAAQRGDIQTLKETDSVGWAIVALIFTGVITGIMLLIAHGPIQELSMTASSAGSGGLGSDTIDKLSKLKGLMDSGVITREEFEAQKALLINPSGAQRPGSVEAQLTKLKSLYDEGVLSKAEYDQQREMLLRKL